MRTVSGKCVKSKGRVQSEREREISHGGGLVGHHITVPVSSLLPAFPLADLVSYSCVSWAAVSV